MAKMKAKGGRMATVGVVKKFARRGMRGAGQRGMRK